MNPALSFSDVVHRFGNTEVLRRVSFDIAPGELFCLLGPSGCGKTTALRIAAGLERPESGRVGMNGRTVTGESEFVAPEARGVGLLFQDYALFPHLTVEGNVLFGLRNLPAAERERRVRDWLQRVKLWDRRHAYPHMLSGGEQQRIALARALAPRPTVLLLDEPFSNLDSQLRFQVREELLRTIKELAEGAAALMVTHDPEEAMYLGDRIGVMEQGRILQLGTAAELYEQPRSSWIATFFGDVNRFRTRVESGLARTPLGPLPAGALDQGAEVDVLIRTEGIHLEPPSDNGRLPSARVASVRRLGPVSRIELHAPGKNGSPCVLRANVLGSSTVQRGDQVHLRLDPRCAFVFPATQL